PKRPQAPQTADQMRAAFDAPDPLTVGLEEELMLLDHETLDLAPAARAVLAELGGDERFKHELPASQLEIVSPPLAGAAEAAAFLASARADLAAGTSDLVRLAAAGVHPFAAAEGVLNPGPRYERTHAEFGRIARRQLVFGLQVHVAVRPADRALAVYNALRSYLPELLALAANAPFYEGRDTGLATVRPKLNELLPRQGVPPSIPSWEAFADALRWGARAGGVPEPRVWWWELRPHPAWGTLEVRVPDAQSTVADAAGVIALVHSLVAWLGERFAAGEELPVAPTWRIAENRWQALARGGDGLLADLETGATAPARERLHGLIEALGPAARSLGCERELGYARALADRGGPERQREAAADGGMPGLARSLIGSYLEPLTG
ncbi:MAG: glutamate---cysteine ligase / carboxylate-amine ligase, partial [Thermoleophilaceae bacterium]|nr:glutamate---cysteine ligase / carboxylate-amine ligase [Thermoleophilaceae bacterium]